MTVATVANRIAQIQRKIVGVRRAFDIDKMPNNLRQSYLPAVINIPAEAEYEDLSAGEVLETRQWRMMLFVTPIERPSDVAKKNALVVPFFRRFKTAFIDAQMLDELSGVALARLLGDDGLDALEYGDVIYAGVEFTLETQEWYSLTASA